MTNESRLRAVLPHLGSSVWTTTSASVIALIVLKLPIMDDPAALRAANHSATCRSCAWSSPEIRAARDAALLDRGAMEAPTATDGLSEGAGPVL